MIRGWLWLKLAVPALLLITVFLPAAGKTEFFKVEDLQPGMKGIGKTCYKGTKPEEFQVEILGVLEGMNPGSDAVLAKFSGGLLEKTGIFEGMSGSPIYIDGKLLGAVAFSYPFAKEAIGGITPIMEMVDAFKETIVPLSGGEIIINISRLRDLQRPLMEQSYVSVGMPRLSRHIRSQVPQDTFSFKGHPLIPIATPLSLGGLHAETLKAFTPQLRALNMSVLQGVGSVGEEATPEKTTEPEATEAPGEPEAKEEPEEPPFEAGSNIVVSLIRGDLNVTAGGTVTYVDGNRLYAFGHSLMELGFTELPMHKADTVIVFPSRESSFKILAPGEAAGTIRQDRGMGISGIVGEEARTVPMRISLSTSRRGVKKFNYELARDAFLTPLLVNIGVYNTIVSSERAQGMVTLKMKGKINVKGEEPVDIDSTYSADNAAIAATSLTVALPVEYLMSGGYKDLDLQDIDLDITVQEEDKAAALDSIRIERSEVKAGETVEVEVCYKKADGEVTRNLYPVKIPENASPGMLTMLIADGTSLMSMDEEEEDDEGMIPRDLTQLIKLLNSIRKNDRLYVRFSRQEPGAVVNGEGLPGLPPSILSVLKSDRKTGAVSSMRTSTLAEYELQKTDYVVIGSKSLKLLVKP